MPRGKVVLSEFVPDVHAIADVEAFGVVLDQPDGHAHLVTRHRAGVAAHLLPLEHLPPVLRPQDVAVRSITPLCEQSDVANPLIERLVGYGIDCLSVLPLPGVDGLFWAGKKHASAFAPEQVAAFASI